MASNDYEWMKQNPDDVIWWVEWPIERDGEFLFSFDRQRVFNFFADYPQELTEEQRRIFRHENPVLAALKEP